MKSFVAVALLLFAGITSAVVDPTRPHFDNLIQRGRVRFDDYKNDFLISQTAEVLDISQAEQIKRLEDFLGQTRIPFKGSCESFDEAVFPKITALPLLPKTVEGDQEDGLKKCTVQKCRTKVYLPTEGKLLQSSTDKKKVFHEFVYERLKQYCKSRALLSYETRLDNRPFVDKAISVLPFMAAKYPEAVSKLRGLNWDRSGANPSCVLRQELMQMDAQYMQPVLRLAENLVFKEKDAYLNFEIHIYTSHFFDSSFRVYEIFPHPEAKGKIIFSVTDIMEVDELKKAAWIRNLFKSRMEETIMKYRDAQMALIRP